MIDNLITIAQLLLCQSLTTAAWLGPARRLAGERSIARAVTLAFLLNAGVTLALAYGLDSVAIYRPFLFWVLWAGGALIAHILSQRMPRLEPVEPKKTHHSRPIMVALGIALVVGLWVRLHDPLANSSLAGSDVYVFFGCLWEMIQNHRAVATYPAGLSVLIGHWHIGGDVFDLMRFGPQVITIWGGVSVYGFWSRIFGRDAGLVSTVILSGSVLIYPVLVQHTVFPQITMLWVCLPLLCDAVPRLRADDAALRRRAFWQTMLALFVLALTSTMYALFLSALLALWSLVRRCWKGGLVLCVRLGLILAVLPAVLLFYYGFALPARLPASRIDTSEQSQRMLQVVDSGTADATISPAVTKLAYAASLWQALPPPLRMGLVFALPSRFTWLRDSAVENAFMLLALAVALVLLAGNRHDVAKREHCRFLGFAMLVCLASVVTGVLELPGYQGRALYLLVLLLIPGGAHLVFGMLIPFAGKRFLGMANLRWLKRLPALIHVAALLSTLPTVLLPPEAGVNVKARGALLRRLPDDNLLTAFITEQHPDYDRHLLIIRRSGAHQREYIDVREEEDPSSLTWKSIEYSSLTWPLIGYYGSRLILTSGSSQALTVFTGTTNDAERYILSDPKMTGSIEDAIRQEENLDWHVIWETPRLLLAKITTIDTTRTNLLENGGSP